MPTDLAGWTAVIEGGFAPKKEKMYRAVALNKNGNEVGIVGEMANEAEAIAAAKDMNDSVARLPKHAKMFISPEGITPELEDDDQAIDIVIVKKI